MNEKNYGIPDDVPAVAAVELGAELTKSWERQTTRIVRTMILMTILGVGIISSINWGVQSRISRARQILESQQLQMLRNKEMVESLKEDRLAAELRYHALLMAIKSVEHSLDQRDGKRKK